MKTKICILVILLFILIPSRSTISQLETCNWYFGNRAGIRFDPITKQPSAIPNSAIYSWEGCACISDSLGNILFYTSGETVWTKYNDIMENGTYLGGRHSSTQTSVIVPKPGSDYLYYIFTADGNESQRFGLSYSIVDMEQNDFDGKVIEKNVRLLDTITEHICAVRHKNKNHIWVITYHWKYNKFYSYLVTESSIEAPVISQGNLTCGRVTGCYLKPNSKGDKIVFANAEVDAYEIFDFDNSDRKSVV